MSPNRRRGPKVTWSEDDDVRLCRAYVSSTQSEDGTEHVKNMWHRVHETYNNLIAEEDPAAAPRAMSALQTHWATLLRPDLALFMAHFVQVENEQHENWTLEDHMREANRRYDATREEEKAAQMLQYEEAKRRAEDAGETPPPKPRGKIKPFRYPRCIPILRESKRFMRTVMSEKKDPIAASRKRTRRSLGPTDADENGDGSEAGSEENTEQVKEDAVVEVGEAETPRHTARKVRSKLRDDSFDGVSVSSSLESDDDDMPPTAPTTAAPVIPMTTPSPVLPPVVPPVPTGKRILPRPSPVAVNGQQFYEPPLCNVDMRQKADYRLRLLAELRGVVETIAQLSSQLVNGAVTLMAVDAQIKSGPTLAQEVKEDLQFFREQKRRLKLELDALETS